MNWQNELYEQIKDKPQTGFFAQLEKEINQVGESPKNKQ